MMTHKFTKSDIKYVTKVFGDKNITITPKGNIVISKDVLHNADTRDNTVQYAMHMQNDGQIYVRRMVSSCYEFCRPTYYVIHRDVARNDYKGFANIKDATTYLVMYLLTLDDKK